MTVRRPVGARRPRLLPHSQPGSARPAARSVLFLSTIANKLDERGGCHARQRALLDG